MALLEFVGLFPEVIYSIPDPKRRTILGSCFAPVVEPRRRNIRVAEPLLDLSDIGLMRQRIGGGSGTQRMDAEAVHFGADPSFQSIFSHNISIHRGGIERAVEVAGAVVGDWTKHGAGGIGTMAGERQVFLDQPLRQHVDGDEPDRRMP